MGTFKRQLFDLKQRYVQRDTLTYLMFSGTVLTAADAGGASEPAEGCVV